MTISPVALITGSGKRRIGFYVAEALARRGYRLLIHYRSSAADAQQTLQHLRSLGAEVLAIQADLADAKSVQGMIHQTIAEFGQIDVLVNAAAIWERKRLEEVAPEDVRRHFEVNTLGTFLCCQHAGLQMVQQPSGGNIITIGDWAIERPYLDYPAYFPSKGAIPALTRMFAVELGTRNPRIRVNSILPGPVMLPPDLSDAERTEAIRGTLVKREGSPQNVVQAVLSLLDNDFITGVCLPVDGGRTIYAPE